MKKSTGAILIIIIILLLGVIGVGGYFFIKGNSDFSKQIGDLKNEVANIGNNSGEKTTNTTNVIPAENKTTSVKTNKDVAGNYKYEIKDDTGYNFGANLFLAEDGTFGCFFEVGGITGSYEIDGNTIVLNVIFAHGGGVGLDFVKQKKTLTIKEDESLETKDIKVIPSAPETIVLTKLSNDTSSFDIRQSIRASIGTGPEYQFNYNY